MRQLRRLPRRWSASVWCSVPFSSCSLSSFHYRWLLCRRWVLSNYQVVRGVSAAQSTVGYSPCHASFLRFRSLGRDANDTSDYKADVFQDGRAAGDHRLVQARLFLLVRSVPLYADFRHRDTWSLRACQATVRRFFARNDRRIAGRVVGVAQYRQ